MDKCFICERELIVDGKDFILNDGSGEITICHKCYNNSDFEEKISEKRGEIKIIKYKRYATESKTGKGAKGDLEQLGFEVIKCIEEVQDEYFVVEVKKGPVKLPDDITIIDNQMSKE